MSYFLCDPTGRYIPVGLCMRIGSDPANDIVLPDSLVSPSHAIIGDLPDGLLIRDEDSVSGTFINDVRIEAVMALKPGDRVKIGDTEFTIGSTESISIEEFPVSVSQKVEEVQKPDQSKISDGSINLTEEPHAIELPSDETVLPPPPPVVPQEVKSAEPSIPSVPPASVKTKKSKGCLRTGLTILLILVLSCAVLGGGGYLLYRLGIIPERLIRVMTGYGYPYIQAYNLTDQTVYIKIQEDMDENTITIPNVYWTLAPYDSNVDMQFSGSYLREKMIIGTTKDGNELGTCIFYPKSEFTYNIVILPGKVLFDADQYPEFLDKPPASGKDLILATSSLCVK
ncbi:FHA domain-containing protein [Leptolinea tardivitalis]|uniref:FHA domain-containing protein n=1 Tax=Leptolinea tardivitalis TaxID=229920 RepID=UPI00078299F5|nr:FHA domain-containing protein [Leptolinea tardivitalis]GAP21676.1 protein containing FOG: FHA domain [Leptolinea tardivitalis]